MTSLAAIIGRDVVSRVSAESLGAVHGVVVDVPSRRIVAWQVGKGRKARLVSHSHVTGVGDAALVVDTEASLREPFDPQEEATLAGHRVLLDARVLLDTGDEFGVVTDVDVDTTSGALGPVTSSAGLVGSERIVGLGHYALVISAG